MFLNPPQASIGSVQRTSKRSKCTAPRKNQLINEANLLPQISFYSVTLHGYQDKSLVWCEIDVDGFKLSLNPWKICGGHIFFYFSEIHCVFNWVPSSLGGEATCNISQYLKSVKLCVWMIVAFGNLAGISAALLPRRLSNLRTIEQFHAYISLAASGLPFGK